MFQRIEVEPTLVRQLGEVADQALICDRDGRVLGLFSPLHGKPRLEDLQLEPPLTIAQTQALRANRSGKPLEEILARLGIR